MADYLATGIAAVALILSIVSIVAQRRGEKQRLFIEISANLAAPESQQRRRAIYNRVDPDTDFHALRFAHTDEYDQINGGIAELEMLAYLAAKGHIPRVSVNDFWGRVVVTTVSRATPFMAHRNEEAGQVVWPNLEALHATLTGRQREA